jgi:hypothetical protein
MPICIPFERPHGLVRNVFFEIRFRAPFDHALNEANKVRATIEFIRIVFDGNYSQEAVTR